ncbi:MAG: hypothetical protein LBS50_00390 [Prevotellaceae bacterium]|jgi:hypothetical protein|nr:hypothetical protein [Prevotellaceae bacterium]
MSEIRNSQAKAIVNIFNTDVKNWGKGTKTKIANSASANMHSQNLKSNIRERFKFENNQNGIKQIFNVGYSFPIQGIWVHYGVGIGYKREGGSVKRTARNPPTKLRTPKDWFNSKIKQNLPELEKIVEETYDNVVINATNIFIKDRTTNL